VLAVIIVTVSTIHAIVCSSVFTSVRDVLFRR